MDTGFKPYQKIIFCILLSMAIIFGILTATSRSHVGVLFRDELLTVAEQGDTTVYSGTLYGIPVTITAREENGTQYVEFSAEGEYHALCRVEYPEGTIRTQMGTEAKRIRIIRDEEVLFSGGYAPVSYTDTIVNQYYNEDGTQHSFVSVHAGTSNPWTNFEFSESDIFRFANSPTTAFRGSWGWYFLALLASLVGALLTAFPKEVFYLEHFMSVQDPEPTDFYYFCHRIGSACFVILALILYIRGLSCVIS